MTINGQPFDPAKTYRVQTIDFLAGGGQGQVEFRDGTNVVYGELTVDVVADYIAKHSPLDLKFDNRIRHK
jgi:2',3'-cyclic-nucleotide 2'-phosphodiesterase (5'-nucleotidase family)